MGEAALTASPSDPTGQPVTVDAAFVEGSAGAGSVAVPVATVPVPMTFTNTSVAAPAAPVAGGGATDVVALALDSLLVNGGLVGTGSLSRVRTHGPFASLAEDLGGSFIAVPASIDVALAKWFGGSDRDSSA